MPPSPAAPPPPGFGAPPPTPPTPSVPGAAPAAGGNASRKGLYVVLGIAAAVVLAVVAVVVFGGGDDDPVVRPSDDTDETVDDRDDEDEPDATEPPADTSDPEPEVTAADTTVEPVPESTVPDFTLPDNTPPPPSSDEIAGAPAGTTGTQASPVAPGDIADIGGGWRLQVLEVVADGAALVAQENEFNDPPPAGATFSLVKVALGYYGTEEPTSFFFPTITAFGADLVELDTSCGSIPQSLNLFNDAFAGAVAIGNLCFVTTAADHPVLQLSAVGDFLSSTDVFLAAQPPAAPPTPLAGFSGPQPGASTTAQRTAPTPINTPAEIGEGWTLTVVGPAQDITDLVMAENTFNDPPPEGFRMVGVGVSATYNGAGVGSAFDMTTKWVDAGNVQRDNFCGVIPDEFDDFADVASGGTLTGTMCFLVPTELTGTGVLYSVAGFDAEPVYFATL